MSPAGLLFDATLCIGCGACTSACKEVNALPPTIEPKTTAYTWTIVEQREGLNVRRLCMHCLEPACASVCPVGALQKTADGPVTYDSSKCIGCRYCIMACPFGVPKYQWDSAVPVVGKCVMCAPRVARGEPTACASACPVGATVFGERTALVAEAQRRIREAPGSYVDHVYGLDEAGGTSVLMLSSVPFAKLGLPADLPRTPLPLFTWQVMSRIPDFVVVWGVFLFGLRWITDRREVVRAAASAADHSRAAPGEYGPHGLIAEDSADGVAAAARLDSAASYTANDTARAAPQDTTLAGARQGSAIRSLARWFARGDRP